LRGHLEDVAVCGVQRALHWGHHWVVCLLLLQMPQARSLLLLELQLVAHLHLDLELMLLRV